MNKQSDRDTIPDPLEAYVMENSSSSPALILEEKCACFQEFTS